MRTNILKRRVFSFKMLITFATLFHCSTLAYAIDHSLPLCDPIKKEMLDELHNETYTLSPSTIYSKAPVYKKFLKHFPENPKEGTDIQISLEIPVPSMWWDEESEKAVASPGDPKAVLYWESDSNKGTYHEIPMTKTLMEKECKYKKTSFLIISKWKQIKIRTKMQFTSGIPSQPAGTTIHYFVKVFFNKISLFSDMGLLSLLFNEERLNKGYMATLPIVDNLDSVETWNNHILIDAPALAFKRNIIEKTQMGFDGKYLYFRIKTNGNIKQGNCTPVVAPPVSPLTSMNAYGVLFVTPEYQEGEKGHIYMLRGWVLAYAPCINKIYGAGDVALYESTTFKKGPIADSGAEYTLFADNDIVMKIPYEKIQPNPSKTMMTLFMAIIANDAENPIGKAEITDIVPAVFSLEQYSFTVQ